MKRLKGLWMTLIIVILSVTMVLGMGVTTAFAADPDVPSGKVDEITEASNKSFYSKFIYGKSYKFAAGTKVIAPNGNEETDAAEFTVIPKQVGAYTVSMGEYSYNVACELAEEYELRVDFGGADIATYLKKGENLTIPDAYLYFKNEDGNYEKVKDQTVTYQIDGLMNAPETLTALPAGETRTKKIENVGTYNVHYAAKLDNGGKYFSQDFTVNVQSKLDITKKPTINVVNVPSEISLRTKVTLPTATTTDDYDANVKVLVSVKQFIEGTGYVNVKEADVDDNGYGVAKEGAADVVFDNKYNMSFYPLENTTYQITYQAVNDAGLVSSLHTYPAKCIDKTAPVLKKIDDSAIPTKWGYSGVTNATTTLAGSQLNITFPYPEYIDNNSENISVMFEIKDTINNKTVIKFNNIYDYKDGVAQDGAKYSYEDTATSNGLYDAQDLVFDKTNGLTFNFSNYVTKLKETVKDATYSGLYTVTYTARDPKPNISTKSFDITLEEKLTDKDAPTANISFDKDYLLVTEDEQDFTIPSLITSDTVDTRTKKTYTLKSTKGGVEDTLVVDGGETAKLVTKTIGGVEGAYLIVDEKKDKVLLLGDKLEYEITIKDDAGNEKKVASTAKTEIPVLTKDSFGGAPKNFTVDFDTTTDFKAGKTVKVGGFTFEPYDISLREYTGFEMTLLDGTGKVQQKNTIRFTYYFDGAKFNVENIEFDALTAQTYKLYVRVFDATGMSLVKCYTCDVHGEGESGGSGGITATGIPQTGGVFTTYQLKNKKVDPVPSDIVTSKSYIVRKVEANGKFSIMDTQFTAYSKGTYRFEDGYYAKTSEADTEGSFKKFNVNGKYTFAADQKENVTWEIQGKVPAYSSISSENDANLIELPTVIGNLGFQNADVTLTVKPPKNGQPLSVAKDKDDTDKDVKIVNGMYQFRVTVNGTYTVTYSATGAANDLVYTIKAGDAVAPEFEVKKPNERQTEGKFFKFDEIVVSGEDNTDANLKNTEFKKSLKDPTGAVVYEIVGSGKEYRDMLVKSDAKDGYKLDKTGPYKVEYTVTDSAGNKSTVYYDVNVSAQKTISQISTKIISTVLIIVGVLLIAGVILYFIRFRKVKNK